MYSTSKLSVTLASGVEHSLTYLLTRREIVYKFLWFRFYFRNEGFVKDILEKDYHISELKNTNIKLQKKLEKENPKYAKTVNKKERKTVETLKQELHEVETKWVMVGFITNLFRFTCKYGVDSTSLLWSFSPYYGSFMSILCQKYWQRIY